MFGAASCSSPIPCDAATLEASAQHGTPSGRCGPVSDKKPLLREPYEVVNESLLRRALREPKFREIVAEKHPDLLRALDHLRNRWQAAGHPYPEIPEDDEPLQGLQKFLDRLEAGSASPCPVQSEGLQDSSVIAGDVVKVLSFTEFLLLAVVAESGDDLRRYAAALQKEGWDQTFPLFSDLLLDMNCPQALRAFQGTTEPLASLVASLHARWHQVGCPPTAWPSDAVSEVVEGLQDSSAIAGGAVGKNDPKLSDGGGWRDGCAGEGGGAASVTAGAVRCSAWLAVAGIAEDSS